MLERVVLSDLIHKNKVEGKLMTKDEKIECVTNWKLKNKEVLVDGGLGEPETGAVPLKFFSGILFSTSGARKAVPFLQRVFQADACHMSFGKGKTCKTPHMEESYFVMSHKYSPILF